MHGTTVSHGQYIIQAHTSSMAHIGNGKLWILNLQQQAIL
jgi:hypothetical protein